MKDNAGDPELSRLESLFAEYVERLNRGEGLSVERIRAEHPDLAEQLIEELRIFRDAWEEARSPAGSGVLGDYTIRREIGRGGMGVVYEAWQNSVDRRVALKVLPPGIAADTRTFTRFVREAKLAAKLKHPSVVSIHGMGFDGGTPYYSMDFVEGETVAQIVTRLRAAREKGTGAEAAAGATAFGAEAFSLASYANAASAFAEAADGLQHAHSMGIVHRDVKPSNLILDAAVEPGGAPRWRLRVLDFGLARLEGQESLTRSGAQVGTPLYMSPEQARAATAPVDHRTDIYSLGATLYEVLTLAPPFCGESTRETLSRILEQEPAPPRRLSPSVPPDLETIVLKCLRKDPADRYATAEALAQDLRRFVRGDPIEARPQTRLEKVAVRLWRRKWAVATAAAAVFLALVGFAAATFIIAEKEKRTQAALMEARADFERAHDAVNRFLTLAAEEELAVLPGKEKTRKEFLESALDFYVRALKEKGRSAHLLEDAAMAYSRVGKVYAKLGETSRAEGAYEQAIEILESLVADLPHQPDLRSNLAEAYGRQGLLLMDSGRVKDSGKYMDNALDLQRKLVREYPAETTRRRGLVRALINAGRFCTYELNLGKNSRTLAERQQARELLTEATKEQRLVLASSPDDPDDRSLLAGSLGSLAYLSRLLGDYAAAEGHHRETLEIQKRLVAEQPQNPEYRENLVLNAINFGVLLQVEAGRPREAEALFREILGIQEKLAQDFKQTPQYHSSLGAVLNGLGHILKDRLDLEESRRYLEWSLREQEAAVMADPARPIYRIRIAKSYSNLADVLLKEGKRAEAEACHRKLIAVQKTLLADFPGDSGLRAELSFFMRKLALHLIEGDRKSEAETLFSEALEVREDLAAERPDVPRNRRKLAESLYDIAQLKIERGELPEARELLERVVREQEVGLETGPGTGLAREILGDHYASLGEVLMKEGSPTEAEQVFRRLVELMESLAREFPQNPGFREKVDIARCEVARALMRSGRAKEGEELYREMLANLEKLASEFPGFWAFQNHFADELKDFAGILTERGDIAESRDFTERAVSHYANAVRLHPNFKPYEADLRDAQFCFAQVLERLGDHRGAVAQAKEISKAAGSGPKDLFRAAMIHARAAQLARTRPEVREADRDAVVRAYSDGAVETLQQAILRVVSGFMDPVWSKKFIRRSGGSTSAVHRAVLGTGSVRREPSVRRGQGTGSRCPSLDGFARCGNGRHTR